MALATPSIWHDVWRYAHTWILLLKWPLSAAAAWASVYVGRWRKQRAENAAQGWPSVDGRIASGTVKPIPKTKRFIATLTYTYFLGEYHSGTYQHEFSNEADANDFIRTMKDKNVPIRYKESNPAKSVLEQRSIEQHILLTPRFG